MISSRQLFFEHLAQTSKTPVAIEIEKAEGIFIFDNDGKKYIDMISGISVSNIGHRHPKVIEAIQKQLDKFLYLMVYGEYIQSPQVKLSQILTGLLPKNLNSVYLVNSGSEAVEGALKVAKKFTRRTEIIACRNAYHGSTHGALSVMGNERMKLPFRPLLPDISFIEFNNFDDILKITKQTACVIIEPVQGEAGVILPKPDYLESLKNQCNKTGTLLIFDEIQTGFGRTGALFAFEKYKVIPDILLLAKAMGGGMPIGAFIASKEIMNVIAVNPALGHITTFGGHPVSCAAAIANIEVIIEENLVSQVEEKARIIVNKIGNHPKIVSFRNAGLLMAFELADFDENLKFINICRQNGLLSDWFLFNEISFRVAPPLTITREEIEKACNIIELSLNTL